MSPTSFVVSDRDEFNVKSSGRGKSLQIFRIGCQDLVAIVRQAHDGSVDRVGSATSLQKHSGSLAEAGVESFDDGSVEKLREEGLAPRAAPPNLSDNAAMREWSAIREALTFDQRHDVAVAPFDGHERARVQDETHAAPFPRPEEGLSPVVSARTTVARPRARRAAPLISSLVISPCSAS